MLKKHTKGQLMNRDRIENYTGGWFVGNFTPVIQRNKSLEVGVKFFKVGDTEPSHMQRIATEITVVSHGKIRIGNEILEAGDFLIIQPLEYADFEALEDGSLICVKFPSISDDKVLE